MVAPCDGVVYAAVPLMHEAACFMRKLCIFGVAGDCKWFWERELKNFGEFSFSRIVQTETVRDSVKGGAWRVKGSGRGIIRKRCCGLYRGKSGRIGCGLGRVGGLRGAENWVCFAG